ncbi:MOSC domain-containing protein [Pseudoroseicyclus tamaricis]|uniref:MOSC domain-containing protein n=1 Tax=Pseudoroseicyclus tamaricis TaxID=2705421 RepID=A0A6B2JFE3_9RHOB|nr:MOSC domain-containing protein [Pseudoroseicyclus tamaricis]NDU99750.1 MOSC domain-containing protein [Pseudoroseicyclus tamaricis]
MSAHLAGIVRHPIKSIGYEALPRVTLTAGQALPYDRHWAVAHEAAKFPARELEGWAAKLNFVRGVAAAPLMAVTAQLAEGRVTLSHPDQGEITVDPESEADQLIRWLAPLWPASRPAPRSVERAPQGALTDVPQPFVSLLSTASNRAVSEQLGQRLDMNRWRGNLWVEGWEPFAEFDMTGREIRIGQAVLRVEERITRCEATMGNPQTGAKDADTLGALESGWGHRDFGVYCTVLSGGDVAVGDEVTR